MQSSYKTALANGPQSESYEGMYRYLSYHYTDSIYLLLHFDKTFKDIFLLWNFQKYDSQAG